MIILNKKKETDSVIIFVRIEKTAGTTLQYIIEKQYEEYYDFKWELLWGQIELYNYLKKEELKKLEVLSDHFHFGIHKQLPQKYCNYLTMLRDPIDRVVSIFYYILSEKADPFHDICTKITLTDFVSDDRFNWHTFNLQTRKLTGNNGYNLDTAKDNLKNHFSIVGITERFNETLYVIEKKLGWNIDNYKKENVTPNRPSIKEIPSETIEIIKRKNQKDIELYKFANKLLDEQLQQIKD